MESYFITLLIFNFRVMKNFKFKMKKGYIFSNIKWHPLVHRLVAIAFIPNPLNLPEVNHKDWNKLNCHKDNLEWSTWSDNVKHAYSLWLMKNNMKWKFWSENHSSVSIRQFDISWKFIKSFWSQLEAMRETWVLNGSRLGEVAVTKCLIEIKMLKW